MFASAPGADAGRATPAILPPRSLKWLIWEKVPLGLIIAADSLITMKAQGVGRPAGWYYPFGVRLANAIVSYARYVEKMFWPTRLALLYPHPGNSLARWQVAGALIFLLGTTAVVALCWQRRYLTVGWLWFLGTMVPMAGLVQVGRQAMADRYAYLPFIGLFLMISWTAAEWAGRRRIRNAVLAGATVLVLLALTAVTHRQLAYWRDNVKLWSHTLEVTDPNNWVAESLLGDALRKQGRGAEALPHFYRALEIHPNDTVSHLGIALYEHENGNFTAAIAHYEQMIDRQPNNPDKVQILVNMGHIYGKLGNAQRARECFEAAGKLKQQE